MDNRIFIELGLGLLVSGFCVIIQGVILLALFILPPIIYNIHDQNREC